MSRTMRWRRRTALRAALPLAFVVGVAVVAVAAWDRDPQLQRRAGWTEYGDAAATGRPTADAAGWTTYADRTPPSEREARAVLDRLYTAAQDTANADEFCARSADPVVCRSDYASMGGRKGVPPAPPRVAGSVYEGSGLVLTLCGVDAAGQDFRSRFAVERRRGLAVAVRDVFWHDALREGGGVVAVYASPKSPPLPVAC